MTEKDRLLKLRKKMTAKRPKFVRCGSWQYVRVKSAWKRPNGIDSRMRRKEKGVARTVNVGYRGPKKVRGLHPTGLEEVVAHNLKDLEGLHRKKHIIKIARTVGAILNRLSGKSPNCPYFVEIFLEFALFSLQRRARLARIVL